MISVAPGTKVYLASQPVSMRLGFDGLAARVSSCFCRPVLGSLFLFRAKRADYRRSCIMTAPECACSPSVSRVASSCGRRSSMAR